MMGKTPQYSARLLGDRENRRSESKMIKSRLDASPWFIADRRSRVINYHILRSSGF